MKIRSVGRLDKDTSGIVVFAKNGTAAGRLARQKQEGKFKKEYLALVEGIPEKEEGIITEKIGKREGELMRMCVTSHGKAAFTQYQVREKMQDYALVSLSLATGRTHQIRVHMAWMGHPLLGDRLYGGHSEHIERAALHASCVSLIQPFTGKEIQVRAELPEDMQKCLGAGGRETR